MSSFYQRNREWLVGYGLLAPMFVFFFVFSILPALFVISISITEWNGVTGLPRMVGFQNFQDFFTVGDYVDSYLRAVGFGLAILVCHMSIGLLVALLLNRKMTGLGMIRTIWYLPVLVSFAVVAQIVNVVLDPVNGVIHPIMAFFGFKKIIFQNSVFWMSFWIIAVTVWKSLGSTVIIYLAALQGIDPTLYEAAKVDGANRRQTLLYVTIPGLRPITLYIAIFGIIASFQIFEPIQLISEGGPQGQTNIILYRIYQDAFQAFNMGMASASSVMVMVGTMILTYLQLRLSKKD